MEAQLEEVKHTGGPELAGQMPQFFAAVDEELSKLKDDENVEFYIHYLYSGISTLYFLMKKPLTPFVKRDIKRLCGELGAVCFLLDSKTGSLPAVRYSHAHFRPAIYTFAGEVNSCLCLGKRKPDRWAPAYTLWILLMKLNELDLAMKRKMRAMMINAYCAETCGILYNVYDLTDAA
jgi:hypothetical protein